MKLIDRFVGRELIVNVLFAIAVLSLVLVVGNIFRKLLPLLVNHDVPLEFLRHLYRLRPAFLAHLHHSVGLADRRSCSSLAGSRRTTN